MSKDFWINPCGFENDRTDFCQKENVPVEMDGLDKKIKAFLNQLKSLQKILNYWTTEVCRRTQLEASEEPGIAQSVISRLWQRFQDDVTAKRNRRNTASVLSRQLSSTTGTTVSRQTVYRRLGHVGLYARRPVRCVPLTATHCHLRLTWSTEHALWIPQQWPCVMFSDESRFSLQSDSRWTLIWRAPGNRYHQENTIE
ncbi:HTH_Tnp_Tc3_2 domain-containing protein [Trichonephila clavipes]|nr:HTH_Tnp_Tc3_2 domain-containing protein [Trichonephila clavipes]